MCSNFSAQISSGASWFVMWHAPWCGHCRKLEPTFHLLAEALIGQEEVQLAMINSIDNHGLSRRYYVDAYPTLMMLSKGEVYRLSRRQPRTPEFLESYVRGGFAETEPELAVLSWRIIIPFHMFVDAVDDAAEWAMVTLKPQIRQCSASVGAGVFCGSILLVLMVGSICCCAALCTGGSDGEAPERASSRPTKPRPRAARPRGELKAHDE